MRPDPLDASKERSFGLSVGGVCAALSAWSAWRGHVTRCEVFGVIAVALIVPALVRPVWLRGPNAAWMRFAHVLGWINSRMLLSLLFFGVLTPVGVARRLVGVDVLRRRRWHRHASTWTAYPSRQHNPRHYERMY